MARHSYPSDLTDAEWALLEPLLPSANTIGSPRIVQIREVVNALLYVADNGIKWRALPQDFPAWQTVYGYFRRWSHAGLWEQVNPTLSRQARLQLGRAETPSLGLMDSQSVQMTQKGGRNKALMAINGSKVENDICW